MKKTRHFKSFEELAHGLQVVQSNLTSRLSEAYSKPMLISKPAGSAAGGSVGLAGFQDLTKRGAFGFGPGIPLRGWGLNE